MLGQVVRNAGIARSRTHPVQEREQLTAVLLDDRLHGSEFPLFDGRGRPHERSFEARPGCGSKYQTDSTQRNGDDRGSLHRNMERSRGWKLAGIGALTWARNQKPSRTLKS